MINQDQIRLTDEVEELIVVWVGEEVQLLWGGFGGRDLGRGGGAV